MQLGHDQGMVETGWRPVWIVDFPMYELDEETQTLDFSHNPFSMPQGGMEALDLYRESGTEIDLVVLDSPDNPPDNLLRQANGGVKDSVEKAGL